MVSLPPALAGSAAPTPAVVALAGEAGVARGRVHELCGRGRRVLAAMLAGRLEGPVLWAVAAWDRDALHPPGLAALLDPGRVIVAACPRAADLLWTAEEGLRSGALAAVVADLAGPPPLTPVRRLQLAAEAGGGRVTGFLLTPGTGGAAGVESRWRMEPEAGGGWRLDRMRARMAPPAAWRLAPARGGALAIAPAPPD
jgi:protein ImuA